MEGEEVVHAMATSGGLRLQKQGFSPSVKSATLAHKPASLVVPPLIFSDFRPPPNCACGCSFVLSASLPVSGEPPPRSAGPPGRLLNAAGLISEARAGHVCVLCVLR